MAGIGARVGLRSALILVSHDRRFLSKTDSRATVWLDRGRTRRLDQGFEAFEAWRDQVLEEEERDRHKLDRKIAMEEDWVRYGVTARRKRNVRRHGAARPACAASERREERRRAGEVKISVSEAATSGKMVIRGHRREPRPMASVRSSRIFRVRILRGDRVGIVWAPTAPARRPC